MATTSLKPKVSRCQSSELKDLRERLKKKDKGDSNAKSSYVSAPPDEWKAMTEYIDTDELEYYLPEMNEDVVDLDVVEETAPMTALEQKQSWIESFMFAPEEVTRGIEPQTAERVNIPDVQQLIIHNEAFAKAPWLLVEHTKEQQKLIKGLIRLKKEALKQGVTAEESALLKADLKYLYKCEWRILKEINTAEIYYRQRLKQIEEQL